MSHTVIRSYTNAVSLFDDLVTRENDVRPLLEAVPGFIRYGLFRTPDGGFTITTCESKEGTDESIRVAAQWIKDNIPAATSGTSPQVIEGDLGFGFGGQLPNR